VESETIRDDGTIVVRRTVLAPGEAMPWHVDTCHRVSVIVRGERLRIEYRDGGASEEFEIQPGQADWDQPNDRAHRGVNIGDSPYEEVVVFLREPGTVDPQPEPEER
jgi:hypothetical protein